MSWQTRSRGPVLSAIALPAAFGELAAQTEELPPPPPGYKSAVPDMSDRILDQTRVNAKWNASLDRFDLEGTLKQYFFRLQWIH